MMGGPNVDSFGRARRKFEESIGQSTAQQLVGCTLEDVQDAIRGIQDVQGREDKLRNMGRLGAFIEAMDQFSKVVEVFLNANEFICFIWGPVKLLLGIAKTYVDSFDKLLDAYYDIGAVLPGLLQYRETFEKNPTIATVLEDYFSDILRFHAEAIRVFSRPKWKKLFHSTWKTFDSEFQPILKSLSRRRELLDSEKSSATLYEIERLRRDIDSMRTLQHEQARLDSTEKHKTRVSRAKAALQAANYELDHEIAAEDRDEGESGQWIFLNPTFSTWRDHQTPDGRLLYLNGKPGAGKTTLVATIVENLLKERSRVQGGHCAVTYFYFKHGQDTKKTMNGMLRAVMEQFIHQDPAMSTHFFELVESMGDVNLRSTKALKQLIGTALGAYKISYLILDGLDECSPGESTKVVEWILELVESTNQTNTEEQSKALRVLLAGQRDGVLDRFLEMQPSIALDAPGHLGDIRAYVEKQGRRVQSKFKLSDEIGDEIISLVANESDGMFLFARVVMDNLWHQTRLSGLKQEIDPGTFPRGLHKLDKAYDRVINRLLEHEGERGDVLRVLGLVTCGRRELYWREVQAFFCIDPGKARVDFDNHLQVTCKELCGSLIDIHRASTGIFGPEDVIYMVHETAKQYLLNYRVDAKMENAKFSLFCSQYLLSAPFSPTVGDTVKDHARKGYYALQDYAVQFWLEHLRQCALSQPASAPAELSKALSLGREFVLSCGIKSRLGDQFDAFDPKTIALAVQKLPRDVRELDKCLNLSIRTARIREVIEKLYEHEFNAVDEAFGTLHGSKTFKCHKPWCDFFAAGLPTHEERQRHLAHHELQFFCPVEGCFAQAVGFESSARLSKHHENCHMESEKIQFPSIKKARSPDIWSAIEADDRVSVVEYLDSGIDVKSRSTTKGTKGWTLLELALVRHRFSIAELLYARNHGHMDITQPLRRVIRTGNIEAVEFLITQSRLSAGWYDSDYLTLAVKSGQMDILRLLVNNKLSSFQEQGPCFRWACKLGRVDTVRFLLQNGFGTFANEENLHKVVSSQHRTASEIVELILGTGLLRNLAIDWQRLSLAAIENNHAAALEALIRYLWKHRGDKELKPVGQIPRTTELRAVRWIAETRRMHTAVALLDEVIQHLERDDTKDVDLPSPETSMLTP